MKDTEGKDGMRQMGGTTVWTIHESPLGALTVIGGPDGIRSVCFPGRSPRLDASARRPLTEATDQLEQYFAGERRDFELRLDLDGTPLQKLVWARLRRIPYGSTISYGELAGQVDPTAYPEGLEPYRRVRLAAAAVGRTPTPILVPCHRVIGADGSLTGYGGGLRRKQALLDLEARGAAGLSPEPSWDLRQLDLL
jgi:methylated-DNA-[protein]-cysteine S-methyltransferase